MPLVGEAVYRIMVEILGVPVRDNFRIITEHDKNEPSSAPAPAATV